MKICKVCGATENETQVIKTSKYGMLCRKHNLQMVRHGKVLKRTIYDSNKFIFSNDMVKIELYDIHGNVINYAVIDYDNFEKIKDYKWYFRKNYVATTINGKKEFLHRIIMDTPNGMFTDHINGNTLDNRKINLRNCSKAENTRNRVNRKRVAGIQQAPSGNYTAVITVNYECIYLGTFDSYSKAVRARKEAEKKYFGEYRPQ